MTSASPSGPLAGTKVIEIEARGPVPYAAMLMADMGATVIRISPPTPRHRSIPVDPPFDILTRGRTTIRLDLKSKRETLLPLVDHADVLVEGFRPGVAERLGIGPEMCLARNPRLVYGRATGWGRNSHRSHTAGHDLTYLAIAGVIGLLGRADAPPAPPLNLIGDYGSAGALLAFGVVCALHHVERSGVGQVVDAAITDGALLQLASILGKYQAGEWRNRRESNMTDGGAPFYDTYETSDGRFLAVAALEPQFYEELLKGLELDAQDLPDRMDRTEWPRLKAIIASRVASRSRDEWDEIFSDSDACVAPVLELDELADHRYHQENGSFVKLDGVDQPRPAPALSKTPQAAKRIDSGGPPTETLTEWGLSASESEALVGTDGQPAAD